MSTTSAFNAQAHPGASPAQAPKGAGNELLPIQRMSVKYEGLEDRIALDVASAQGRVARLWLTRYGADTMVLATAALVESYATVQLAKARVAPSDAEHIRQSALATQQLTARLTKRNAPAVELTPGSTEHLVIGFAVPPPQARHPAGLCLQARNKSQGGAAAGRTLSMAGDRAAPIPAGRLGA